MAIANQAKGSSSSYIDGLIRLRVEALSLVFGTQADSSIMST